MNDVPEKQPASPDAGRRRFAAVGSAVRVVKALPAPLRERVLDRATSGVGANLPPFPDVLRLVEAAGGIPDGRRWQDRLLAEQPHLREVETREVPSGGRAHLRARLYLPPPTAPPAAAALVWVHGGAFVIGSLDQREAHWPAVELAAAGVPVLSVDYRKCIHGVHFPAPQDDVLDAWRWAVEHADELGVTADRLHLGGASAGGCLVAGAVLRLRDSGRPQPASLYLAYPVLQGDLPPASPAVEDQLAAVTATASDTWIRQMFGRWAGDAAWDSPYVSPGLADPAGLPPTYVLTCGRDVLRRASEPFVDRLREAAVPVWHDVLAESEHAPLDRPGTPDGDEAVRRLHTWLTASMAGMADRAPS